MIGEELLEIRKMRKMSRDELSEKSGVHSATIVRIESGDTNPTYDTLSKLLNVLGFELSITKMKKNAV